MCCTRRDNFCEGEGPVFLNSRSAQQDPGKNGFSQVQRPRWFIRYPRASPLRALLHFGLQKLALDGGLRMVAYRGQTKLPTADLLAEHGGKRALPE